MTTAAQRHAAYYCLLVRRGAWLVNLKLALEADVEMASRFYLRAWKEKKDKRRHFSSDTDAS